MFCESYDARNAFLLAINRRTSSNISSSSFLPHLTPELLRRIYIFVGVSHQCTFLGTRAALLSPAGSTPAPMQIKRGPFDRSGALYYIGTEGGTCRYTNPHESGEVHADMSSVGSTEGGVESNLGLFVDNDHDGETVLRTKNAPGQWMSVDLGCDLSLVPSHYSLRHGAGSGTFRLRNWKFEGSHDGRLWDTLVEHRDDHALPDHAFSIAHWPVPWQGGGFRHFRIIQTGPNSRGRHYLFCAGLELYGELRK
jgi:hypothetical protein